MPDHTYDVKEYIGPYKFDKDYREGNTYILDGFQRLSTILGCLINPNTTKLSCNEEIRKKDYSICYDLMEEEFIPIRSERNLLAHQVPLYILIDTFEFISFSKNLESEPNFKVLFQRAQKLATTLVFQLFILTEVK